MARGNRKNIGRRKEGSGILLPAEKSDPVQQFQALSLGFEVRAPRPVAGQPQKDSRQPRHRLDQDVECLVMMKSPKRQDQRRVLRCCVARAVGGRRAARIHKIRNEMGALAQPAAAQKIFDQIRRVADQMIAMPVMPQIVVAAEPRDVHEFAARHILSGAGHVAHHDLRLEGGDRAFDDSLGREIEPTGEGRCDDRYARGVERRQALRLRTDDRQLNDAGQLKSCTEPREIKLRAALFGARHHLQHPDTRNRIYGRRILWRRDRCGVIAWSHSVSSRALR